MTRLSILLLILSLSSYAQKNAIDQIISKEDSIKKTIKLNKNELINQANKIIASKYPDFVFNPLLYEITTWENSKKTIVNYRRIIRFTPYDKKDENLIYDFEVDLISQNVFPFDTWGLDRFYLPTIEEQEKIDFVIKAFGLPRFGFNNKIIENANMYSIYIDNEIAFGKYFIDKTTGKECMGSIEGSYAQPPDLPELLDIDPLIEIKE
ncbi:hypothetical protein [Neotamlana laminarinivorans]|uniref:Uncharacterized protein n=1 Tax=Neotamlana laminarinivorans TaxID=2883124 RepID=A0A9X1HWU7_9FLAO|nr:hypothetical protein [Tamlana laminarinivorans]MCB4797350.1 hypothetical protein [Tamlana laminarinivorans]